MEIRWEDKMKERENIYIYIKEKGNRSKFKP